MAYFQVNPPSLVGCGGGKTGFTPAVKSGSSSFASCLSMALKNQQEGGSTLGIFYPLLLAGLPLPQNGWLWYLVWAALCAFRPSSSGKATPAAVSRGSGGGLMELVADTARRYGLDEALLKAVVKVESGFNVLARSPAGAQGLMQLMPETAAALGVKNPWDARENLDGGARYLKYLLDRYGGNIVLALAAYNAGPGAVERYGGIPPYRETQEYVRKVLAARREFWA